jgi:hypoxanthine phosphoribosyltransferase
MKQYLTHEDVARACRDMRDVIKERFYSFTNIKLYGVPRGGIPVLYMLMSQGVPGAIIVDTPEEADVIIDDLIDGGGTRERYTDMYPNALFLAAFNKYTNSNWLIFPWEQSEEKSIDDAFVRLFQYFGEHPIRDVITYIKTHVAKTV